jgi:hypothetical protein
MYAATFPPLLAHPSIHEASPAPPQDVLEEMEAEYEKQRPVIKTLVMERNVEVTVDTTFEGE